MIRSDLYAEGSGGVLREACEAADGQVLVVNPTRETLTALVGTFRESPPAEPVRLLAARQPLRALADDFVLASLAAELVAEGSIAIRTLASVPRCSLLVTEESVVSLVECEGGVAGLTTTRPEFVASAHEEYTARWERAEPFSFRTPPLSEIRTSLEAQLGPAAVEDFDRALAVLDAGRDTPDDGDDPLDEVTLALLVAATNGELLYDISRWGEEIRLASKATFSRTKTRLEEAGLVATEKVPIDVGRPRLRLVPGDSVETEGIEPLVRQTRSALE